MMRIFEVAIASELERASIYRTRHQVYACELGQHLPNALGVLTDDLDEFNFYLVVRHCRELCGFISITPPDRDRFSFDKYLDRDDLSFSVDDSVFEVRLLTVLPRWRGSPVALLLMWAAFRWIEECGGRRIVAIGRREIMPLYLRARLERTGIDIQSGQVSYELMHGDVLSLREQANALHGSLIQRLEQRATWRIGAPAESVGVCVHGGRAFEVYGDRFERLDKTSEIIDADVLDAWFPPAPAAVSALKEHLSWSMRTSPPADARGLVAAIAEARGIPLESILLGAGSSALIFLAMPKWLNAQSRALVLDPMYGEYAHVLENVVGCVVDRLTLRERDGFGLSPSELRSTISLGYDLVVIVNPNNPTGVAQERGELLSALTNLPSRTRVWIDEAYVDYSGPGSSLESIAVRSDQIVVCKSLSKVYALSGLRAAYLVGSPSTLEPLRRLTPPWAVSLPAQMAAVAALGDPAYYSARYTETHALRRDLLARLRDIGALAISESAINMVLVRLPEQAQPAHRVVEQCRARGLYLRGGPAISPALGLRSIRVAVKDSQTNDRIVQILATEIGRPTEVKPRSAGGLPGEDCR